VSPLPAAVTAPEMVHALAGLLQSSAPWAVGAAYQLVAAAAPAGTDSATMQANVSVIAALRGST
jgi:hypothetical protein